MTFTPSKEKIISEILIASALAQTLFISIENLVTKPYLRNLSEQRVRQELMERLLAIAIKSRFLDDRYKLLLINADRQARLYKYWENGNVKEDPRPLRMIINKLIHHESISVKVKPVGAIVVEGQDNPPAQSLKISRGIHSWENIVVTIQSERESSDWKLEFDLLQFLEELLRVLTNWA